MQFFHESKVFFIINFLSETLAYLKFPLSVSLPDHLNFLQCLSRFRVAFKTSISNQGLVLDFTLKVLIGETESTADKNLVTKSCYAWFTQVWVVRKFYWSWSIRKKFIWVIFHWHESNFVMPISFLLTARNLKLFG